MIPKQEYIGLALKNEGFEKLPHADKNITDKLTELYFSYLIPEIKKGESYWSISRRNEALSSFLNRSITDLVYPYLQFHFDNIKPIVSSFFIKLALTQMVTPRQDWTFVDGEPNAISFTCWLPLVDTNGANGMMGFIPGSHNEYKAYHASPTPSFGFIFLQSETVFNKIRYIQKKADESVVFNHPGIHAYQPNKSDNDRSTIGFSFTSMNSRLVHMLLNPGAIPVTLAKKAVDEGYSNIELKRLFENGSEIPDYELFEDAVFNRIMV